MPSGQDNKAPSLPGMPGAPIATVDDSIMTDHDLDDSVMAPATGLLAQL